jgi:hypothetical protein
VPASASLALRPAYLGTSVKNGITTPITQFCPKSSAARRYFSSACAASRSRRATTFDSSRSATRLRPRSLTSVASSSGRASQSIKLSGFKSFAEPTNFQLPGQLVGVVGPNGCGKSNIMDAVRWVLGESKASELRGESMQDVIFNGTTTRKPASRSSVELVFDNADHRAGGQWGQFAEIAVKRVLTRDGTSSYYINNQPVRRRDVQDVFLGTGLGPRAYAIIGQGTISRIIESKPEELRLFLEEAAGVSKYKERRRETENRLHDTRENLTRVEDILRELNANLDRSWRSRPRWPCATTRCRPTPR